MTVDQSDESLQPGTVESVISNKAQTESKNNDSQILFQSESLDNKETVALSESTNSSQSGSFLNSLYVLRLNIY